MGCSKAPIMPLANAVRSTNVTFVTYLADTNREPIVLDDAERQAICRVLADVIEHPSRLLKAHSEPLGTPLAGFEFGDVELDWNYGARVYVSQSNQSGTFFIEDPLFRQLGDAMRSYYLTNSFPDSNSPTRVDWVKILQTLR